MKRYQIQNSIIILTKQKSIKQIGLAPTKAKNLKKMALQIIEGDGLHDDWI